MGLQQQLLIVIVTIIIGIATIVAIDTMDTSRKSANESAVRQDIFSVLTDARMYYEKSALWDGSYSFDDFSMSHVHSIQPTNENGSYTVLGAGHSVTVQGIGTFEGVTLSATGTMISGQMDISWSE